MLCRRSPYKKFIAPRVFKLVVAVLIIGFIPLNTLANDTPDGKTKARNNNLDWLKTSGFGRIVGGYIDVTSGNEDLRFVDYENKDFSFSSQSLIGMQVDASYSKKLKLSAQAVAHSNEKRESGLEWLYLSYKPNDKLTTKIGKLRLPFFNYSDVINVGYAYQWITPPRQVYLDYLFSNYNGVNVQYSQALEDAIIQIEGSYGQFDDDIMVQGQSTNVKVDDLRGVVLKFIDGAYTTRLSYHEGFVFDVVTPLDTLAENLVIAGFKRQADVFNTKGKVSTSQFGIAYNSLTYFYDIEIISIDSDIITISDSNSGQITLGYNVNDLSIYANYAVSLAHTDILANQIPLGLDPRLDQLSFVYDQTSEKVQNSQDELQSYSLGLRWDFRPNFALKFEISRHIGEKNKRAFFSASPETGDQNSVVLYQTALEWVF